MTDANPSTTFASAFPAPPPFYKHFTTTNLARLKEAQDTPVTSNTSITPTSPRLPLSPTKLAALPSELLYLIPPSPPPPPTTYQTFSTPHSLSPHLPSLSSRGLEQLIPPTSTSTSPNDPTQSLLNLSKSLLLSFLELIALLSTDPSLGSQKIEDLRILFVNAHALVNAQRAHGAREALIAMMEKEVSRRRGEVERVSALGGKVDGLLRGLGGEGPEAGGGDEIGGMHRGYATWSDEEKASERERRMFSALKGIDIG